MRSTYEPSDPKANGVPTQEILNADDKWGHGQFGVILTGNVQVCPNHLEYVRNAMVFQEGERSSRNWPKP
ncbi:unnamed protein product [Caenorhabditis sp. 36 PRJEB53466]|nr:unnamed protein product [Caenorhabditis sp. 36 PRJEB53466]